MKMDYYETSEYYARRGRAVMEKVPELQHLLTDDVRITFRASSKAKKSNGNKTLGECIKVKDLYSEYCPYDFMIVIYEPNCEGFTEEQYDILLEHELLHVGVTQKGDNVTYYIIPHNYEDFKQIIDKYGTDWCL